MPGIVTFCVSKASTEDQVALVRVVRDFGAFLDEVLEDHFVFDKLIHPPFASVFTWWLTQASERNASRARIFLDEILAASHTASLLEGPNVRSSFFIRNLGKIHPTAISADTGEGNSAGERQAGGHIPADFSGGEPWWQVPSNRKRNPPTRCPTVRGWGSQCNCKG
mmetsp:Transcript_39791/g.97796  ORF Transcript_39791/g.97796 Transcript_39791/m.97796 type:complete len:166 (-) Transcript_39791:33-530(-)